MKMFLLILISLLSISLQAQVDKDFGNLVPDSNFIIKNKTVVKDGADISNYEIKVTPEIEEFTYKPSSVKTPKSALLKRKNEKLVVNRVDGKVSRISSLTYDGDGGNGSQNHQTVLLSSEGKVNSFTNCYQKYSSNFLGMKTNDTSVRCITVTTEVCKYIESKVTADIMEKMNSCNDTLKEFQTHQDFVNKHTKNLAKTNIQELGKLDKKLMGAKNLYELENKSLANLSDIVDGYQRAIGNCEFLGKEGYLGAPVVEAANPTEDENTSNQ